MQYKKLGLFIGGLFLGTAGKAILSCDDAKNLYTKCTAAVLRGKDCVMKTANTFKENCQDIYDDAIDINEDRYEARKKMQVEAAKAIVEEYEGAQGEE